jgi:hypothetical protein
MALKRGDRGTIAGHEVVVTDIDGNGAATIMLTGQPFLREVLPPVSDEPKSLEDWERQHAGHGTMVTRPSDEFRFVDYSCPSCGEVATYRIYDKIDPDHE